MTRVSRANYFVMVALVKKGSRLIEVDGVTYRWRVRGKPTYSQGNAWSPMTYAVELADAPGTVLVVATNQPHLSNWLGRPGRPIRAVDVARSVRAALDQGWQPGQPGSAFQLDLSQGFTSAD